MSTHDNVVKPVVEAFLDTDSETFSYVVYDHVGGHAAIIDPVLDYDPKSGRTRTDSAQQLIDYVRENKLTVDWILETHAHADHLSAAQFVRDSVGGKTAIGEKIVDVQKIFRDVFNLEKQFLVARHVRIVVRSSESVKFRWRGQDTDDGSIFNRAQRSRVEKVIAT